MKNKIVLIGMIILIAMMAGIGKGQKVEVDQSFVDDATKAFDLVVAQRKTIESFLAERAKTDAERSAAQTLIKAYDDLIKVKDQISTEKDKLIAFYEKVVALQMDLIDRLEKKLLKPKSFFQKLLATLRDLSLIALGLSIGRGL